MTIVDNRRIYIKNIFNKNVSEVFKTILMLILATLLLALISNFNFASAQNEIRRFDPFYRAYANVSVNQFRPGVPPYYVVQPGDTYYSIAQRFLANPAAWAQSWEMPAGMPISPNGQLQPGSIVVLSNTHDAKMRWFPQGESALAKRYGSYYGIRTGYNTIKLLPVAWGVGNDKPQVLPPSMVEPFIVQANIVPYDDIYNAPIIAGFVDNRLIGYAGKTAYVRGNIDENIQEWYVYRNSEELIDPETYRSLGYVSRLQGIVRPIRRAPDAYEFQIVSGNVEIERGARLVPVKKDIGYQEYNYQRPNPTISARVVGIYDGSQLTTQFRNVIINRGSEQGVKRGDVFNLLRYNSVAYGGEIPLIDIPMVGYGQIYVYRVEANTSFALILQAEAEVALYDYVRPDNNDSGGGANDMPVQNNQPAIRLQPQVYSTPVPILKPAPYRISR